MFLAAVAQTAARDYTPAQLEAWARPDRDRDAWARARARANTRVAEVDGRIAGFTDVTDDGYIDMMFVDPDHGARGVATALLAWAETTARATAATRLSTRASITARPFFEARGFAVVEECTAIANGVTLTNYQMIRPLD